MKIKSLHNEESRKHKNETFNYRTPYVLFTVSVFNQLFISSI